MNWYLIIGVALTAWTLLLLLSAERQRRIVEIESKRQHEYALAAAAQRDAEKQERVPVLR